jgi:hypothetical protein
MGVWIAIGLLALVKMSFAAVMLWLPFRDDAALDGPDSSDEDGGSKVPPMGTGGRHPRAPLPRLPRHPRRGPHGEAPPPSPPRTRRGPAPVRVPCRR